MRVIRDILLLLILVINRVLAQETNDTEADTSGNWQVLYRLVKDCVSKSEPGACLKLKFLTFLDRAYAIQEPLMLTDYLTVVRDPDFQENGEPSGRSLSQTELQTILLQSPERKNEILDDLLSQKVDAFFNSRSLQLNLPIDDFTGRSKKKKKKKKKLLLLKKVGLLLLAGGVGLAGIFGKLFIGKLALIAGKALLISKIALVLSAVMLLKKLKMGGKGGGGMGGGGAEEITAQVIYATPEHEHYHQEDHGGGGVGGGGGGGGGGVGGGGGGGGWWERRNIQDAHDLAYNSYRSLNHTATSNTYPHK